MTYVQVDRGLLEHPKTRLLARLIDQHPRYAIGLLYELWDWAMTAKPDGMIGDVPRETIQSVFGFRKDLVAVLIEAGFVCDQRCLGRPGDHRAGRFHDWDEYAGGFLRDRERNRLSHLHARGKHLRPTDNCPRCEALSGGQRPKSGTNTPIDRSTSDGHRRTEAPVSDTTVPTVPTVRNTPSPHRVTTDADWSARAEAMVERADQPWREVLLTLQLQAGSEGSKGPIVQHFEHVRYERRDETHVVIAPNELERDWITKRYLKAIRVVLEGDVVVEVQA